VDARQFFEELSEDFGRCSDYQPYELLRQQTRLCVTEAEKFYHEENTQMFVECRRLYIRDEHNYVIDTFKDGGRLYFPQAICKARPILRTAVVDERQDPFVTCVWITNRSMQLLHLLAEVEAVGGRCQRYRPGISGSSEKMVRRRGCTASRRPEASDRRATGPGR